MNAMALKVGGVVVILATLVLGFIRYQSQFSQAGGNLPPVLSELKPFKLITHEGKPFTLDDMKAGPVYVVNFFFTTCPGVCPLLTEQMKTIEKNTRDLGNQVKFLSITVDPQTDSPALLKAYGEKHGVDFTRWTFLTGKLDTVETVVINGFQTAMGKKRTLASDPDQPSLLEITHGEHFVLVDRQGQIRAYHTVKNEEELRNLLATLKKIL